MIDKYCIASRIELPKLPCNYEKCPWFVRDDGFQNCFWAIANRMSIFHGGSLSVEEIAKLEGITEQEVEVIISRAMKKIRAKFGKALLMEI